MSFFTAPMADVQIALVLELESLAFQPKRAPGGMVVGGGWAGGCDGRRKVSMSSAVGL